MGWRTLFCRKKTVGNMGYQPEGFRFVMENVHTMLKDETELNSKEKIIDFVMEAIREDLKMDYLTSILYSKVHKVMNDVRNPLLPSTYYNKHGEGFSIYIDETTEKEVYLATDCVLAVPWDLTRYKKRLIDLSLNPFVYKKTNHKVNYYVELGLSHVDGGKHSIGAGIVYKKGIILAREVSLAKMFPHVYTDGRYWFNQHTNNPLKVRDESLKVFDFRIAILYELAKLKNLLLNS